MARWLPFMVRPLPLMATRLPFMARRLPFMAGIARAREHVLHQGAAEQRRPCGATRHTGGVAAAGFAASSRRSETEGRDGGAGAGAGSGVRVGGTVDRRVQPLRGFVARAGAVSVGSAGSVAECGEYGEYGERGEWGECGECGEVW